MHPREVATGFTLAFVTEYAPAGSSILEIGCGEGDLAAALSFRGYRVSALESDPFAAAAARARGVNVSEANWPDAEVQAADVVLFSRSLHHIHDLSAAVARAGETLRPGGRIIVEDFDYTGADESTIEWFVERLRLLDDGEALHHVDGELASHLVDSENPRITWKSLDHSLHSAGALRSRLSRELPIELEDIVPYCFRYLIAVVSPDAEGEAIVRGTLEAERFATEAGTILPIGRRFVAR